MIRCPVGSQPIRMELKMTPVLSTGVAKPLRTKLYYLSPGPIASTIAAIKAAWEASVAAAWAAALSVKYVAPTITIRDLSNYYNPDVIFAPAANGAWAG